MKFFIGIVPPEEIYTAVADIQKRFGDNRLEPHITVRPPVTVAEESGWIRAVEHVCSSFSPIRIDLPSTGFFGKRVLFIDVSSKMLTQLHYLLIDAIQPFEKPEAKKNESTGYHPHLTLGRLWCGFTKDDFVKMKKLADAFLTNSNSFSAYSVRVYYKPSPNGRYSLKKDIPLSAQDKNL